MGGRVVIVARYENGETISFKTNTGFFDEEFNTPYILNENWFKEKIKEHDFLRDDNLAPEQSKEYENRKALKAPYHYGINLIDYKNKTILTANGFGSVLYTGTSQVLNDYRMFFDQDFELELEYEDRTEIINLLEERFQDFYSLHFLSYAVKNNVPILRNKQIVKHNNTLESVIESLYDIKLEGLTNEEKEIVLNEVYQENRVSRKWSGFIDIQLQFPNWTVTHVDDNAYSSVLNYMIENDFIINEYEHKLWKEFLNQDNEEE